MKDSTSRSWLTTVSLVATLAALTAPACSDDGASGASTGGPGSGDPAKGAELYQAMCASCHGVLGEGGVGPALDHWTRGEAELVDLIDREMPYGDPARCTGQCAIDIAAFILKGFPSCAPGAPAYAPRQLRLLNRREYNATIRDLFAVPASAACAGDADCDVAHASCVAGACADDPCKLKTFVFDPGGSTYKTVHVAGAFNGWPGTIAAGGWPMTYLPGKNLWVAKHAVDDGTWQYKLVLDEANWITDPTNPNKAPDGFGGFNSALAVSCAGQGAESGLAFGDLAKDFPVESRPKGYGFDNSAEAGLVTAVHVEQYLKAAEKIAGLVTQDLASLLPCDPSGGAACADAFVRAFGKRAFRRPLSDVEAARYSKLITAQADFKAGVSVALQVMLSSPYFLYRFEVGQKQPDGAYRLTPWETASALSYLFWGTLPDAELFAAAESGALATAEGVEQQARRLLADPRSRPIVGTFALQWLGVDGLAAAGKNAALYPAFTPELKAAMLAETRLFLDHVIFDGTRRFDELLTADYTFASAPLADLYGIAGVGAAEPTQVQTPPERRAGLLGHGSVLATYAHSDQSSPIRRGLFVRNNLLCQELGAPPPNAGGVPDVDPNATTRERFAQHTADEFCKTCHQYIDPVGFGFERFDAIGALRDEENGHPIDASGDMNDVEQLGSGTHASFKTLPELAAILAESSAAKACFTRQARRFAHGYLERPEEICAVRAVEARFAESGYDIQELLVAIAAAPSFTLRK